LFVEMRRKLFMRARRWGPLKGLDFRLSFVRRRDARSQLATLERALLAKLTRSNAGVAALWEESHT
jgi:hypothetical protein